MHYCFILIACFFMLIPRVEAKTSSCTENQCIAVIDAGSSGSRLHIFSYERDENNTPTHINEIWSQKIKPGFASLDTHQNTINTYLNSLFFGAPVQQIPVYFYATAGMRLVPQVRQQIYYQNLKNWFNQQGNWSLIDAKTITGEEEALYDWLSVNYHLGSLQTASKQTIGVMDIGGASVQIAFPIQKNTNVQGPQVELNLYGRPIHLFVSSFLGLGQNEMAHQLFDSPSCFPDNYPLPDGQLGQGDALECAQEISALVNGVHHANLLVQPALLSNPVRSWYVIGGLSYTAESKPFQFANNQFTTQDFLQQANNLTCHHSWNDLSNQDPNNENLDAYCLLPAFYYSLMVDGYGFSPNQVVNYIPSTQNVDWALGVVLYH